MYHFFRILLSALLYCYCPCYFCFPSFSSPLPYLLPSPVYHACLYLLPSEHIFHHLKLVLSYISYILLSSVINFSLAHCHYLYYPCLCPIIIPHIISIPNHLIVHWDLVSNNICLLLVTMPSNFTSCLRFTFHPVSVLLPSWLDSVSRLPSFPVDLSLGVILLFAVAISIPALHPTFYLSILTSLSLNPSALTAYLESYA